MFTMPAELHRAPKGKRRHFPDRYEVMAEMTAMWKQTCQAGKALADQADLMTEPTAHMLTQLAQAVAKRETWEQAIMLYAGWNGTELDEYLAEVKQDDHA